MMNTVMNLNWKNIYWKDLNRIEGGELDTLEISNFFKKPRMVEVVGKGGVGLVYKSKWHGLPSATKVLKGNDLGTISSFRKEAGILAGLSHPNIIQFVYRG